MPLLREKPHHGLPSSNPAVYLSFNVCKSTTVLGLRAAEHLERVRSRSTGKERDAESGNDYFGARYFASSMGRMLSPDPLGGSLANPQSLNKYAYAFNNPLTNTDPTGLYVCADDPKDGSSHCASKQDQAFEKSLNGLRGSSDSDVARAAGAYGKQNDANGVTVGFADLSKKGEGGNTVSTLGSLDGGNTLSAISNVTISTKVSGADFDAAIGHEGSHVADAQDVVKSGIDASTLTAGSDITHYQSEQRAYGVTNSILNSENESRKFDCGMSTCSLGRGTMTGQLPGIVDDLLSHSPVYNVNGKPMSSTNQGGSVVNGVNQHPNTTVPH